MQKRRIQYIDMAKGIGVFLVILGHMPNVVPEPVRMWIFSFHMPLFYFVSGVFAKECTEKEVLIQYVLHKTKKLLILGYLVFGILFLLTDMIVFRYDTNTIIDIVKQILIGTVDRVYWFFLSIFIVSIIFLLITYFVKNVLARAVLTIVLMMMGALFRIIDINVFRIGSSLYAFGFYYLGYITYKKGWLELFYKHLISFPIAMTISIAGNAIMLNIYPFVLDINHNYHHDIVVNYSIAIAGIFCVLFLCHALSSLKEGLLSMLTKKYIIHLLSYIGAWSFLFFPITDYMPGAFNQLFGGGLVIKLTAYLFAFGIAFATSIVCERGKNER